MAMIQSRMIGYMHKLKAIIGGRDNQDNKTQITHVLMCVCILELCDSNTCVYLLHTLDVFSSWRGDVVERIRLKHLVVFYLPFVNKKIRPDTMGPQVGH